MLSKTLQELPLLEATARRICESRGGSWSGTRGMARCPVHDDRTPSLGVMLGRRAILFHCFAGCEQASVIRALREDGGAGDAVFSGPRVELGKHAATNSACARAALRIWRKAGPLGASPAETYLARRGITTGSPELRFNAATPLGSAGRARFLPAMVAAVSLDEGPIAIHRTFLNADEPKLAAFENPKRALGDLRSAAVRLFPPATGTLGLAEGIESALSARALTGIPCWATLGNERFGRVRFPESVAELHLFVDHDAGGDLAAARALEAHRRPGRSIRIRRPSCRATDWNDELETTLRRKQQF